MDIIFLGEDGRQRMQLALPRLGALAGVMVVMAAAVFYGGVKYGIGSVRVQPIGAVSLWRDDLALQQSSVAAALEQAESGLDALTQRLGKLQARVERLDALGSRLVADADLAPDELSFYTVRGIGGPEGDDDAGGEVHDFVAELRRLEARLADRQPKLEVLSLVLSNRDLQRRTSPSGIPVEHGRISSRYGYRPDPTSGRRVFHRGTDFAGPRGTRILAAAHGVVTEAGVRTGYGKTVKLSHPDGYATRYAHNATNLVAVGDVVRQGQPIALMGASGRATGTHLHYEVYRDGKSVDPKAFLHVSR